MTSATSIGVAPTRASSALPARPSFWSMLGGEVLKLRRMWLLWISLLVLSGFIFLPTLISIAAPGRISDVANAPAAEQLHLLYRELGVDAFILRFFSSAVVLILTARLVGMEYSGGTIRIVLSRGVGRLQLLGVKWTISALLAFAVAVWGVLLTAVFEVFAILVVNHNLGILQSNTPDFWRAAGIEALVLVITLEVMVLLATAVTVLSRSVAFGLSAGLAWFFVDNMFATIFFILAYRLTNSDGWLVATGDLLGANLNAMANLLLPKSAAAASMTFLSTPLTPVTSGHTFLITAIYAVIFVAVSVALVVRRDVKE